jgi:hypothetical protein
MRTHLLSLIGAAVAVVTACSSTDREPTAVPSSHSLRPSFAITPESGGLPDLVVDAKRLDQSWKISTENIVGSDCAAQEGEVPLGVHRLMRFTVSSPNAGTADLVIGDPMYHYYTLNDGLFEFASCHGHFHYRNYATYELVSVATGATFRAAKRGFCLEDDAPAASGHPQRQFTECGTLTTPGNQGQSIGWADVYDRRLPGQYFVLDDPRNPVPPGEYLIRITVNPPFACTDADATRPRDPLGLCHDFLESDYTNNVGEARVTVP